MFVIKTKSEDILYKDLSNYDLCLNVWVLYILMTIQKAKIRRPTATATKDAMII